jgi:hypothetical protein
MKDDASWNRVMNIFAAAYQNRRNYFLDIIPDIIIEIIMNATERRKYERHAVQDGTLAVLRANPSRLGQIEDISLGGIKFHYIQTGEPSHEFPSLTLLKIGAHNMIKNLPFSIVNDSGPDNPLPYTSLPLRHIQIKFGRLTENQKNQIDKFINSYRR